jgi:ATP-binding cassette, subfamily B, bacterial PglK
VKNFVRTLRQALALVGRDRRWPWAMLVVLALVVTGIEAAGAILIYTLMGLVASPGGEVPLPLIGDLATRFPGVDRDTLLVATASFVGAFFVVRALAIVGQTYVQNRLIQNAGARLASHLARGYLEMPYLYHTQHNSSVLVRNAYDSVKVLVGQVLKPMVNVIADLLLVIGLLTVMVVVAPTATLLAVGVLAPLIWLLLRIVQPRLKQLGRRSQTAKRETLKFLQQSLAGVRDIKLLHRENFFGGLFAKQRAEVARVQYIHGTLSDLPRALIETVLVLVIVVVFTFAVLGGDGVQGVLSTLGLFAYAALRLQPSLRTVVTGLNNIKFGAAVLDDLSHDVAMVDAALAATVSSRGTDRPREAFSSTIELENVSFSYGKDGPPALRNINLTIRAGESIGICGPTGGGKSTLVDLMVGLLTPTTGRVLIDGTDLAENPDWWHDRIGVVSQNVFLTDDTLRRNIAFGVPDRRIDDERLRRTLQLAQLEQVIPQLPEGLETYVGERGVRLSGGQRQRVAIARALYREPQVLVFDEGTSALDTATEMALVAAVAGLGKGRTLISVAHRLSTVRRADRIVLVDGGRIVGEGRYDELLESSELFRTLAS